MLIGQFVDTYPPCVDGVGRVAFSYCKTLQSLGHQAWYIAPKAEDDPAAYEIPVLLQRSLPIPGEPFRLALPRTDVIYRRQLDRLDFDLVHAHSPFAAGQRYPTGWWKGRCWRRATSFWRQERPGRHWRRTGS